MPLDLISRSGREPSAVAGRSINVATERLRLLPVSADVLTAHRERMLHAHSPDAHGSRRWRATGLAASGFVVGTVAAACVAGSIIAFVAVLAAIVPVLIASLRTSGATRSAASWIETTLPSGAMGSMAIPEPIRLIAEDVQRHLPTTRFVLGELRRKSVVLDPYLIAEHGPERVVLGIWEGNRVIACARKL